MDIISEKARNCLPCDLETRLHSMRRVLESGWSIRKALSYYKVKRTSFWRWRKRYDGTEASLADGSRRPLSEHPGKTPRETAHKMKRLRDQARRNAWTSVGVWARLNLPAGCSASYSTVLRCLKRLDGHEPCKTNPKRKRGKKYHTPEAPGEKWQIDVKYVPSECRAPGLEGRFHRCAFLDEATRKRFPHHADEHSMYETVRGLGEAIGFFGREPKAIQTDNGFEFSDRAPGQGEGFLSRLEGRPEPP